MFCFFFFVKQKTAYEMRISDWSSDVCSSDLGLVEVVVELRFRRRLLQHHRGAAAERLDIGHMPGEEGDHPSGEPPLSPVPANDRALAMRPHRGPPPWFRASLR